MVKPKASKPEDLQYTELVKTYSNFIVAYHNANAKARTKFDLPERLSLLIGKQKPSK